MIIEYPLGTPLISYLMHLLRRVAVANITDVQAVSLYVANIK